MKKLLLVTLLTLSWLIAAEVTCETMQSSIKKIRCNYISLAQEKPRQITFHWISPDNKADNLIRVQTIPSGHISVVDYRYFSGRSEGEWIVSVSDDTQKESVTTKYIKDSNAKVFPKSRELTLKKY